MADHNDFGRIAEEEACKYLLSKHYEILVRNFRVQKAEIDIIAKKLNQLIIVEVKARSDNYFINPEEAVNRKKMKLIIFATDSFCQEYIDYDEVRFDIIAVLKNKMGGYDINHIKDAFQSNEIK